MTRDHDILFIPGPVEVEEELRAILSMPLVGHRSQRVVALVKALGRKLGALFLTRQHALFETCPATALMEAAIRNLVNERVLHVACGAFGERWAQISKSCGRTAELLAVPWGTAVGPELLREQLRRAGPYEAIAITHNETSTGAIAPLAELCAVVREVSPQALILADVVTSLGGAELRFDDWGLDLAFAGTQKCLALPPGLCVYALSERALQRCGQVPARGWLLDFERAVAGLRNGETLATPCVPLLFALDAQLERIAAEGLPQRWARHRDMQQAVVRWAGQRGFSFFVGDAAARSPTVSTLHASGRDVQKLADGARARGFVLDRGYGKLKGQTFRIGHMGDHTLARLEELLASLD
jgi:predicted phosphoserine aminotransferase